MRKSKTKRDQPEEVRIPYKGLAIVIGMLVVFAGIASGVIHYGISAATCMRAPVAATRFMAGYTYNLPGDSGYGPSLFNEYYCTEQEAKDAGFRRK